MFLCACQELAISIADHWKSRTECDHCRQILDCFVFPSDVKANPSSICTEIHVDNSCRHKAQTHQNIGKHVRQKSDRTHARTHPHTHTHPQTGRFNCLHYPRSSQEPRTGKKRMVSPKIKKMKQTVWRIPETAKKSFWEISMNFSA